jgi:hypothetical protein
MSILGNTSQARIAKGGQRAILILSGDCLNYRTYLLVDLELIGRTHNLNQARTGMSEGLLHS